MKHLLYITLLFSSLAFGGKLIINGQSIEVKENTIIDFNDLTGDILAISDNGNVQCHADMMPPSLQFDAFPSSTYTGGWTILRWDVQNAVNCEASGDWIGPKASADGSYSENIVNLTESSSFTLTCSGPLGEVEKTVEVDIDDTIDPRCNNTPPINIPRQTNFTEYTDVNFGIPFGTPTVFTARGALNTNEYLSLRFDSPVNLPVVKVLQFDQGRPADGGPAPYTVVISSCPGDFTNSLGEFCKVEGDYPILAWAVVPGQENSCYLEPGEQYYLNIVHSLDEESGYTNTSCSNNTSCGFIYEELFLN